MNMLRKNKQRLAVSLMLAVLWPALAAFSSGLFWTIKPVSVVKADLEPRDRAEEGSQTFNLSFKLERLPLTNYENMNAVYSNYWSNQPDNQVFDKNNWELSDFAVEYELHIDGQLSTYKREQVYRKDGREFSPEVVFSEVRVPYNKIETEYYVSPTGSLVAPYLLHYDLYLKKSDNKMILRVPRINPADYYEGDLTQVKLLSISEPKFVALNGGSDATAKIYLNDVMGNDAADGRSEATAVKTFAKAKSLAAVAPKAVKIIVTGTTQLAGEISLAGTAAEVIRAENFNGYLFAVSPGKKVTLRNIVIDGNSENNDAIESALINVEKAELDIGYGTVIRNNRIKAIKNNSTQGGGIYATESTLKMTGGRIEKNRANFGGGICLRKSTMNFSGGQVSENEAPLSIHKNMSPLVYSSAGGGIAVADGSTLNLSGEAAVLKNKAAEIGGGISLGTNEWGNGNFLNMRGGVVDGNEAGSSGGGIFIQAKYYYGGASVARIEGGRITANVMNGKGKTEKAFGGGGIYVNGALSHYNGQYLGGANGELYLKNALITQNTATFQGGGLAACPISKTKIYATNGAAIFGNNGLNKFNDIFIFCRHQLGLHGGEPEYSISSRMLGGTLYKWKNAADGLSFPSEKLAGKLTEDNSYIGLYTEERIDSLGQKLGRVIISGNHSATRGGGIGSNGNIIIGEDPTTSISVRKKWEGKPLVGQDFPAVTVGLWAKVGGRAWLIEKRQLSKDINWQTVFEDLPVNLDNQAVVYSILEDALDGYNAEISGNTAAGFTITNKAKPTEPTGPTEPTEPTEPTKPIEPNIPQTGEKAVASEFSVTTAIVLVLGIIVVAIIGGSGYSRKAKVKN